MRKMFVMMAGVALGASAPALAQQAAQSQAAPAAAKAAPQAAPAASSAPNWAPGAQVKDTAGGAVGTIARVDGNFVILKTDKHEVRLPKTSFTPHQGGFIMAMTQAQVNAEVEKAMASADEKIAPGATVSGSQGARLGTIEAVEDGFVTVKLTSGKLVRLPRTGLAPGPNGAVVGMTVAELEAAAGSGEEAAPSD